jgi:hypothetical protein
VRRRIGMRPSTTARPFRIKQLNLLNAAQLQNMRMQQDTQTLQAETLEQLLAANLEQRNLSQFAFAVQLGSSPPAPPRRSRSHFR